MSTLTFERAKEHVCYDPETGNFTWIIVKRRVRIGSLTGCIRSDGYRLIRIDKKLYLAHRLAWLLMTGAWPIKEIDHIDGNPKNNVWNNLREATHAQNITNQTAHRDNSTGQKGVHQNKKNGRFYVTIKNQSFGGYPTLDAAKAVYDREASKIFGEFYRS
jgi:hypothetical protein